MRRLVSNTVLGVQVAAFALVCLAASPLILFKFGVDWVRERIECRWPDSYRARAVSYWFGVLAPFVLCVVLLAVLSVMVLRVRELQHSATLPG